MASLTSRTGARSLGARPCLVPAPRPSHSRWAGWTEPVQASRAAASVTCMGRVRSRVAASWRCDECDRTFSSERGLEQHNEAKHWNGDGSDDEEGWILSPHTLDHPVDSPGHWVEREHFWGKKSFGAFECRRCSKTWLSAHAFKIYRQGCKSCNREYLPRLMWVNQDSHDRDRDGNGKLIDPLKPHDSERCEACRLGQCQRLVY